MKFFLTVASLVSLAFAFWAGVNELNYVLGTGLLAFFCLLFVANLDRISEFTASGSGFKAKTRAVITKAENTISELQSLSRIFAYVTFSIVMRAGRYGGFDDDEKERIKESVLDVLKELEVSESDCVKLLSDSDWYRYTEYDYALSILGYNTIPQGFDTQAIQDEWKALRDFKKIPSPNQLKEFLKRWDLLDEARSKYIKDYEHYRTHRKHFRPDVWETRHEWGVLKKP